MTNVLLEDSEVIMMRDERLMAEVAEHPFPLLFATVSGAHLYGFPSADSDVDLRGAHVAPLTLLAGLERMEETLAQAHVRDGMEVDLVTHEARKFFSLLLRDNGYVLEQLYSPLVVHTTPEHEELKVIARGCISRRCARHYLGFAANQWQLFAKEEPRKVKPLLYVFRVLLTGIHMMRSGEVNANLTELNAEERLVFLDDFVALKRGGAEDSVLPSEDVEHYASEYRRLRELLVVESERSTLPERATAQAALTDLLHRTRLNSTTLTP